MLSPHTRLWSLVAVQRQARQAPRGTADTAAKEAGGGGGSGGGGRRGGVEFGQAVCVGDELRREWSLQGESRQAQLGRLPGCPSLFRNPQA